MPVQRRPIGRVDLPTAELASEQEGRAYEWLAFHRDLRSAAAAATDVDVAVSVILIRVGNFVTLAGQHGQALAEQLMESIREAAAGIIGPYGTVYRCGKSEFGAILPGRALLEACDLCDALTDVLGENKFEHPSLGDMPGMVNIATCAGTCDPDQSMLHFLNELSDGLRMRVDGDRLPTLF